MPIYAYRCKKCGTEEEHIQRMSDPPATKCETCGGKLERTVTAAAFHLKGGGWYKDGYASTKPEGSDSASGGSDSKSDGGSSSNKDSGDGGTSKPSESKADKKKKPKKTKTASTT